MTTQHQDARSPAGSDTEPGLSTGGAVRGLVRAMGADLAGLGRWLRPSAPSIRQVTRLLLLAVVFLACAGSLALLWAISQLPLEKRSILDGPSVLVEAADGEPLGRVGPLSNTVSRQDFPERLVKAVLSIEDRRFHSHWGVDPWGIARAARVNWAAGAVVEGGSTITQQLVKVQLVGGERSLDRKVREALTAVWLEARLGKDEILTRYLNNVYLGAGAYGMAAAARTFFDKSMDELTLAELAMLAGLIQAPSRNDPIRNLGAAQARAGLVLDAMRESGAIDATEAASARANPATLKLSVNTARAGSWFADWIAKQELPKISGSMKRTMRVRGTLEPDLQRLAERIVTDALSRPAEARGATQAALVAMRPDGAVVAMVGGRDYGESQFNRAADAQRQPGSAYKLFVYYAALRNGYAPDSTIDASPIEVDRWLPENYGGQQHGQMSLSDAFAQSVNTAAVRLAMTVGLGKVAAAARELGLDAPLREVPSMALGTSEVSLLDLTGAFASVRAGRPRIEPWGILAFGPDGAPLRSLGAPAAATGGLPQRDQLLHLLRNVVEHGTGRAAAVESAAGKTGTSQDHRDAWFVGFNDDLVVGVWVGNDDRSPMNGVTGGSLPAQIWKRFVSASTPLVRRSSEPRPQAIEPPTAMPSSVPQCDVSACAVRYNSFRQSDCTYQPYSGARKMCEIQERTADASKRTASEAVDSKTRTDRSDRSEESPRQDGGMGLGGPGPRRSRDGPRPLTDLPDRLFGTGIYRRMDRNGSY